MARVELRLPHHLENGAETATVSAVLHGAGEPVRKGEPVLELLNSFGIFDLPAPVTGIITEVAVRSGDQVRPGAVVLIIESPDKSEPIAGAGGGKGALDGTTSGGRGGKDRPDKRRE